MMMVDKLEYGGDFEFCRRLVFSVEEDQWILTIKSDTLITLVIHM